MTIKSPAEIAETTLSIGTCKVDSTRCQCRRLITQSILAGAFIALGGALSFIIGFGFPGITAGNPALQKLLSGCVFPIGLILVVVLGAELFTGNNALLIPAYMRRTYSVTDVLKNWTIVYFGNFIGAIAFTWLMFYMTGLSDSSPYREAITNIAVNKVSMPWLTVLIKGIGANWCVCLAVWLALSGSTLVDKSIGCWFPVMAFVALGYEHSIANMFFIPAGMMQGADVTVGQAIWNNLIPATIGNIIGGALLVGCVHTYVHLRAKS